MWIYSKSYGLSNTDHMEMIKADKFKFELCAVFNGERYVIGDDERDFERVRQALENNLDYVEVS